LRRRRAEEKDSGALMKAKTELEKRLELERTKAAGAEGCMRGA